MEVYRLRWHDKKNPKPYNYMALSTKQRTSEEEIMDDFSMEGDELRDALDKIATINQWLGGNRVTIDGVSKLLRDWPTEKPVSIIDIGCGNGDMCRAIANFGRQKGYQFSIVGIDANAYTISHANAISTEYPGISYAVVNVFSNEFKAMVYDIALCTLTLHHFTDDEIVQVLTAITNKARVGIVINDLHRSALAYRLFQLICGVFRLNTMSKQDGLVSILRGFKERELVAFSRQLTSKAFQINWRWAFRYQWIIKNE